MLDDDDECQVVRKSPTFYAVRRSEMMPKDGPQLMGIVIPTLSAVEQLPLELSSMEPSNTQS